MLIYFVNMFQVIESDIFETYKICLMVSKPARETNVLDIIAVLNEELVALDVIQIGMSGVSGHQLIYCDLNVS